MRVTVTGGAGYIGATAARELLSAGHEVTRARLAAARPGRRGGRARDGGRPGGARRRPRRRRPPRGARRRRGRRAPGGDRRRPGVCQGPRAVTGGQRRGHARAGGGRRHGAHRVRVDVLQLRPHGRPAGACRRDRAARAGLALRRAEGRDRARAAGAAERDLPALRHHLRRRRAHALRPHGERVHARPVGRPHARRLRRAVLAPVRARRRRGAGAGAGARDTGGARGRPRVQRRPQRRELPQARPRRADPRAAARGRRPLRAARRGPARLPRLVRAHPLRARLRPA